MRETESQLVISCHQTKPPALGLSHIQMSCWLRVSHGNPQTTQTDAKTVTYSRQMDSETPLLRTTSTQCIEYGEEFVPT